MEKRIIGVTGGVGAGKSRVLKILAGDFGAHVTQADEVAQALETGLLTTEQACLCMRRLDSLLREIYAGRLLPSLEEYWPS